jgi:glutamyl-tRNA reductase
MTTILIIGGYGATGQPLTRHLLKRTDANIIIAGRSLDKAKAFADSMNDPRVTFAHVDAADESSLLGLAREFARTRSDAGATTNRVVIAGETRGPSQITRDYIAERVHDLRMREALLADETGPGTVEPLPRRVQRN